MIAPFFDIARYHPGVIAACYFVAAGVALALLLLVGHARPGPNGLWTRRAFSVNIGLVILVLVAVGARHSTHDPVQAAAASRVAVVGFCGIGPSTLSFVYALLGWRAHMQVARLMCWVLGGIHIVLTLFTRAVIDGGSLDAGVVHVHGGWILPVVLLVALVQLALALALCYARARATPDATQRHQLNAVLLAYGVGALGALDVVRLFRVAVPPSSWLWLTIATLILTYAARVHHLLDTPELGWRALAWLVVSALAATPAPLLLLATASWKGWGSPLIGALVLEAFFLCMIGIAWRVQPALDRTFLRRRRDLLRDLDELADALLVVRTAAAIEHEVSKLVARALFARLVLFVSRTDERWREVPDALARTLRARIDPLTLPEVTVMAASANRDELVLWFAERGASVVQPLSVSTSRGGLVGMFAVSARRDGAPFVSVELLFLRRLGEIVAEALGGAELYDRRLGLHRELEEKVAVRAADLARARDGLVRAHDKLVDREKMATLGLVVGGVAHDLEAAVSTIDRVVPELERDLAVCDAAAERALAVLPDDDETRDWLREACIDLVRADVPPLVAAISEGARRARGIAGDLSLFARPGARDEEVDLAAEVDAALRLLGAEVPTRLQVVRELPADLPHVRGDPGAIGQVLVNLVFNAAQAIEGQGTITVRGRSLSAGERVEITVADNGRGIAAENLSRIFEPFFSTKSAGSGRGGSGLGLFVSYGIIQRHGGDLQVTSELGVGTELKIVLPVNARSQ